LINIFKALSDENRLRILNLLMNYELCVCELEVVLDMTQSNVSRHLSKLRGVGIIASSKDGQWVHYMLDKKFENENEYLVNYLKDGFVSINIFKNDLLRCKVYKESNYNCQNITNDKNVVCKYISDNMISKA
jgi:ArsR family transcriptional regulator